MYVSGLRLRTYCFCIFFFNDTATTEIYTLSLHDALPIRVFVAFAWLDAGTHKLVDPAWRDGTALGRSEERTSELQSRQYLVCRLLLEKKKTQLTRRRWRKKKKEGRE